MSKESARHRRSQGRNRGSSAVSAATAPVATRTDKSLADRWGMPLLYWSVACVALVLASNLSKLSVPIALIPSPDNSLVASTDAWNPWLSYSPAIVSMSTWPTWMVVVPQGLLIALIAEQLRRATSTLWVVLPVIGLCQIELYGCLLAGFGTFLVIYWKEVTLRDSGDRRRSVHLAFLLVWGISGLVLASTLEAAIPLLLMGVAVAEVASHAIRHRQQMALVAGHAVAWAVGMLAIVAVQPGLSSVLVRPLTAIVHRPPNSLLPSLAVVWEMPGFAWPHALLLFALIIFWGRWILSTKPPTLDGLLAAVLTALAIGSGRYLWLAAVAITLVASRGWSRRTTAISPSNISAPRREVVIAIVAVVFAALFQVGHHGASSLSSITSSGRIDPRRWDLAGPVLLSDLDQTAVWQSEDVHKSCPLLVSDRWDIYGDFYAGYAQIFDDWRNWREDRYVRSDGKWGGYGQWFDQWEPKMIVVRSDDLASVRQHSLDSPWKVLGIDSQRVVFANSADVDSVPLLRETARLISILEIPRPARNIDFDQAVAFGGPRDGRRVSLVLSALRFPFAALRVLPEDQHIDTRYARTFALLESAHRTLRYTGAASLLGYARALAHSQQIVDQNVLSATQLASIDQAVGTLQEMRRSTEVVTDQSGFAEVARETNSAIADAEIRQLLLEGDFVKAVLLLETPSRIEHNPVLQLAAKRPLASAAELLVALQQELSGRNDLLSSAEGWTTCGMLAIELGDFATALEALKQARSLSPQVPTTDLLFALCSQIRN